jgi:hypothetical protein
MDTGMRGNEVFEQQVREKEWRFTVRIPLRGLIAWFRKIFKTKEVAYMSKWNSRKFVALIVTLVTNLLVYLKVDSETAQTFSTALINALTLGYLIIQGWVDTREIENGTRQ